MSHSLGMIFSRDEKPKVLAYYEYDGTSDVCRPRLFNTSDEVHDNWRTKDFWRECKCGNAPTPVWIYSGYGGGFYWEGEACLKCHAITKNLTLDALHEQDKDQIDGRPDGKPTEHALIMAGNFETADDYYPPGVLEC